MEVGDGKSFSRGRSAFNTSLLVIVLPMTTRLRPVPTHIVVRPPEGGIRHQSAVLCDGIRSISKRRLIQVWGVVSAATLNSVENVLKVLLGIH